MILPTFCVLEPPFNIFSSSSNCFFTKNRYLQWADAAEGDAAQHNAASAAAFSKGVGSTSLEDPLHQLLKGSQLAESLEGLSWAPEVWVDLLTDCATWIHFGLFLSKHSNIVIQRYIFGKSFIFKLSKCKYHGKTCKQQYKNWVCWLEHILMLRASNLWSQVIISLLIQLVRINDLKSWTHLALTATVLAILKGQGQRAVLIWNQHGLTSFYRYC